MNRLDSFIILSSTGLGFIIGSMIHPWTEDNVLIYLTLSCVGFYLLVMAISPICWKWLGRGRG